MSHSQPVPGNSSSVNGLLKTTANAGNRNENSVQFRGASPPQRPKALPVNGDLAGLHEDVPTGEDESLRIPRTMGLHNALAIVMGIVIGSGIFVSPVGVLKMAGSFGAALLIWLGCGFVATVGGLCYTELATMIQLSGGDYAYIYHAFGPVVSFLYIWIVLVIILPAAIAILAQTFSIYLIRSIQETDACPVGLNINDTWAPIFLSLVCVAFLIAINCYEIKWANNVQFLFTGAKIIALVAIIGIGVYNSIANHRDFMNVWSSSFEGSSLNPSDYALSFYIGIFSYAGWNTVTYVTEEIKHPEKNMPRAILIGLPLITLFYIAVNIAYFSTLSFTELVQSDAVAVTLGMKIHPILGRLCSAAVMLSTFGAINGAIFVTSRLFFVGARSGCLPAVFALIHVHRKTPVTALVTLGLLSAVYILLGSSTEQLMKYASFVEVSFIGVTIAGLIWLRFKWPQKRRPFRVPLVLPVIFLVIIALFMIISLAHMTKESFWGIALIATGVPVYFLLIKARQNQSCNRLAVVIYMFAQKLFIAAPEEDVPSSPRKNPNKPLPSTMTFATMYDKDDNDEINNHEEGEDDVDSIYDDEGPLTMPSSKSNE